MSFLAWECLGIPQEELEGNAGVKNVWVSLLSLMPMDGWMESICLYLASKLVAHATIGGMPIHCNTHYSYAMIM